MYVHIYIYICTYFHVYMNRYILIFTYLQREAGHACLQTCMQSVCILTKTAAILPFKLQKSIFTFTHACMYLVFRMYIFICMMQRKMIRRSRKRIFVFTSQGCSLLNVLRKLIIELTFENCHCRGK